MPGTRKLGRTTDSRKAMMRAMVTYLLDGYITKEDVAKKLFDEISPKYADRNGGYTRIVKIGVRRGDAAEMAILELV